MLHTICRIAVPFNFRVTIHCPTAGFIDKGIYCMRLLNGPLISNGYTLNMTSVRLGWLEPSDTGLPLEQLREKYRQSGYLWLKGFFNQDVILRFRDYFF